MCEKRIIVSIFVLLISCFLVTGCEYGEISCLKEKFNNFLKTQAEAGDAAKNVVPLDPLKITRTDIVLPPDNGNFLNLFLTSHQVTGLSSATVTDMSGFGEDISGPHSMTVFTPKLSYAGDYDLDISLAGIAAKGTGQSVISFLNATTTFTFTGTDSGKGHMLLKDVKTGFDTQGVEVNFVGISEEINANFNKFGLQLVGLAKSGMLNAFAITFREVIQPVLDKVPYSEIFS